MQLKNSVAIVTGGASGLGAATGRALIEAGAKLAILDINIALAQKVATELDCIAVECDVTNDSSATHALAIVKEKLGIARILVNCAGIATPTKIVSKNGAMSLAEFEKIIKINLIGSFNLLRLVAAEIINLEPLEDGERGIIINTASIAAYEGQIGQAAYAASKGGIVSLTLPAAREFAKYGIRVNSIAPGLFSTPLVEALPIEIKQLLSETIPYPQRLGLPKEYARLVLHIIENTYINGETIRIDGALRMQPK